MSEETPPQIGKDLVTLSQASRHLAETRMAEQDWSGLPLPVIGLNLVLEPRYKHKALEDFRWKECYDEDGVRHTIPEEEAPQPSGFTKVNSWWSSKYQSNIVVLRDQHGRAEVRFALED